MNIRSLDVLEDFLKIHDSLILHSSSLLAHLFWPSKIPDIQNNREMSC